MPDFVLENIIEHLVIMDQRTTELQKSFEEIGLEVTKNPAENVLNGPYECICKIMGWCNSKWSEEFDPSDALYQVISDDSLNYRQKRDEIIKLIKEDL
jgi:hypothetical protein